LIDNRFNIIFFASLRYYS